LVDAFSIVLSFSVGDDSQPLVNFDPCDDSLTFEVLGKVDSFVGGLFGGLFVEDDSRDVVLEAGGRKEHVSVLPPVLLIIFKFNGVELLIH